GFGIPVLEAMTVGVPVVAATGSCLEEVGGDAALYSDPDDYSSLASNIRLILSDSAKAQAMVEAGLQRTALFTPEIIASELMSVYRSVL
ncbi:MAG: glycosyltransferase, partial [Muribaculaceae bacterium]|nr:glycosyltransferase [Muribaculaceae bacterium]